MELEGSLKAFSLPEVLQFLSMGKMSGILHLDRTGFSIALTIKGGRIVNSSTLRRSRRLGEMLVLRGLLKRRDLEEILSLQKTIESDKKLGELLVDHELVTEQDLRQTIRLQLEEEIWDLFSWEDGHFKFEHGDEAEIVDVLVTIDIEPLLLEGSRRQDEWAKIRRSIPDNSMVFVPAPLPADYRRTLKLRPIEWKVLSAVTGHLSIDAVVNRCSLGRFETCHIMNHFLTLELVRPAGRLAARSATPATGEPSAVAAPDTPKPTLSPEAVNRAQTLASMVSLDSGGRRFGGFFGGRPKPATDRPAASAHPLNCVAPVSEVAALVTAFVSQLLAQKDFSPKPEEASLLETLWRSIMMEHIRADILVVAGNVIDPTLIEDYILKTEFLPIVQECHEEAVEAILHMLKIVYRIGAQRLGEKTVQKILLSLTEAATANVTFQYGGAVFNLTERCNRILGVAA